MSIIPIIKKYDNDKINKSNFNYFKYFKFIKNFKKYKFKKVIHQFFPIDHFFFFKNFLNYWKPDVAIFLESEIWPSMFKI